MSYDKKIKEKVLLDALGIPRTLTNLADITEISDTVYEYKMRLYQVYTEEEAHGLVYSKLIENLNEVDSNLLAKNAKGVECLGEYTMATLIDQLKCQPKSIEVLRELALWNPVELTKDAINIYGYEHFVGCSKLYRFTPYEGAQPSNFLII